MNYRMVFNVTGKVIKIEGFLLLLPTLVALCYSEWTAVFALAITASFALIVGLILPALCKPKNNYTFAKEGLITVALAWLVASIIGAFPFVISQEIPNYIDALFETVSGFTTTGASILENVEALSHGMLFWRSFTHWIGGMGILVFVLATTTKSQDGSMHIMRAEMPGPTVDKLVPKARKTSLILYLIYVVMTLVLIIMLLFGGLDIFESSVYAFGPAGTGGFSIKSDGLASATPYVQWVIAIFMLLFGINFNLYFLIIIGKVAEVFKSSEFWVYLGIVATSIIIVFFNIYDAIGSASDAIRHSVFQVSSLMTTTGFATYDFNAWPSLAKTLLLMLMFIGGCAGSTAGGFKVSRIVILIKKIVNDVKKVIHPRTANVVKFEGKKLGEETINGVTSYLAIYILVFIIVFLLVSFDPNIAQLSVAENVSAIETNLSATLACINNIGPGLGLVGPMSNFASYTYFSKIVLTFAMLFGRLEIYPVLLLFSVRTWMNK